MTRTRALQLLWLCVAILVWNTAFDQWVVLAQRDYLVREAAWELGRGPQPVMAEMMSDAVRGGALRATAWTAVIVGAGLFTLRART